MEEILSIDVPFTFIVGGRGTGKTYGTLKYFIEHILPFIFMRRTQTQIDLLDKEEFTPFNALTNDLNVVIESKKISKNSKRYELVGKEKNNELCITTALSTISNIRGFSAEKYTHLLYDEFIPELHDRPIKGEAEAFFNAYETICRNRELKGLKPLKAILLANANRLDNPIFLSLGIIRTVIEMQKHGISSYLNKKRGFLLIVLDNSPISDAKKGTALYSLLGEIDSDFAKMALSNDFDCELSGNIRKYPLIEFIPLISIGEICIYKHKSRNFFYTCGKISGTPIRYKTSEFDLLRFNRECFKYLREYYGGKMFFMDYLSELMFLQYFKKR